MGSDVKRTLTAEGKLVYGHEQLHIKDYVTKARDLAESIAKKTSNGTNPADCKKKATAAELAIRKAFEDFRNARIPGGEGEDITHGGPGQPVPRVGVKPEGEPGPWIPQF